MRVAAVSDLHGEWKTWPRADVLILAGDFTRRDTEQGWQCLQTNIQQVEDRYGKIVLVAGNHDGMLANAEWREKWLQGFSNVAYLEDSGIEIGAFYFWGMPWTPEFCNWYFMGDKALLKKKCDLIPTYTDVLITHGPPYGILDAVTTKPRGCLHLRRRIEDINPRLHVFGHIHEHGSVVTRLPGRETVCANVSAMDSYYNFVHGAVCVDL